ncbi:hypothetical protein BKA62DRAFT_88107 [Auriculariales sp. MPI-PUGE-AT-0066]|nr:hypothetical protein BKA62DRAFT_88107 [Auriculariales sp. MPI-PUGE-AT-0066]
MTPPRVLNTYRDHPSKLLLAACEAGLVDYLTPPESNLSTQQITKWMLDNLPGAAAVLIGPLNVPQFGSTELDIAGPQFKAVSTFSVGYDHIDVSECKERGVKVGNTPNVGDDAVANLTMLLLLMVMRRASEHVELVRAGQWPMYQSNIACNPLFLNGQSVRNRTIGFFGMGRIAQKVVERILPMGPGKILYKTSRPCPFTIDAFPRLHIVSGTLYPAVDIQNEPDLLTLAEQSDVLICLTALVPATRHSINQEVLSHMKRHAILINVSRGPVVDTEALMDALRSGQIFGAGLDVLEGEPNIVAGHPLLDESVRHRVVLLPHCGSAEVDTRIEMADLHVRNILLALDIPLSLCGFEGSIGDNRTAYL